MAPSLALPSPEWAPLSPTLRQWPLRDARSVRRLKGNNQDELTFNICDLRLSDGLVLSLRHTITIKYDSLNRLPGRRMHIIHCRAHHPKEVRNDFRPGILQRSDRIVDSCSRIRVVYQARDRRLSNAWRRVPNVDA